MVTTSMDDEAVFRGKVVDLRPARMKHPHLRWQVIMQVEDVLSGNFPEQQFIFGIHSPAKSRIVSGGLYRVHVVRQSAEKFLVKSVDRWTDNGASDAPANPSCK